MTSRDTWVAAAALAVTLLDGFDAMSLSLVAAPMSHSLGLPTHALGLVFGSVLAGMITGGFGGGLLADRFGRLKVLLGALALFGLAAAAMPFADGLGFVLGNRVLAGLGLGAAAPIAVALATQATTSRPADFVLTGIWSGMPMGGVLAAVAAYLLIPHFGWASLFVAGALAPVPVAIAAVLVFRADEDAQAPSPDLAGLLERRARRASVLTMAMFFFGYVTTAILTNWLPALLSHRGAGQGLVSAAFIGINLGAVAGSAAMGRLSDRFEAARILPAAWAVVGGLMLLLALPWLAIVWLCVLGALSGALAAGSQALSVALASRLHPGRGLESSTVGLMVGAGRIGQVCALGISGAFTALGLGEGGVFLLGATGGALAALMAVGLVLTARRTKSAEAPHGGSASRR